MIEQHSDDLEHPLVLGTACLVLQYVDDTLILLRGTHRAAATLKIVLEDFTAATGLAINYHKSTFVPLHLDDAAIQQISSNVGCLISTFPQPYLGLPLSTAKLRNLDSQPLMDNLINTSLVGEGAFSPLAVACADQCCAQQSSCLLHVNCAPPQWSD